LIYATAHFRLLGGDAPDAHVHAGVSRMGMRGARRTMMVDRRRASSESATHENALPAAPPPRTSQYGSAITTGRDDMVVGTIYISYSIVVPL